MELDLRSPWPFGTGWMWKILVVFGAIDPPRKPEPNPVDLALEMLTQCQRDLLRAQSASEQASATATMFQLREERLKYEYDRLRLEGQA